MEIIPKETSEETNSESPRSRRTHQVKLLRPLGIVENRIPNNQGHREPMDKYYCGFRRVPPSFSIDLSLIFGLECDELAFKLGRDCRTIHGGSREGLRKPPLWDHKAI